jgi:hypothetical protein
MKFIKAKKMKIINIFKQQGAHEYTPAQINNNMEPAPSVQSTLFSYLKPAQQEYVKPLLRVLKKKAQEELCVALLDYMETGKFEVPQGLLLGAVFYLITRKGVGCTDDPNDERIIRPLRNVEMYNV